MGGLRGLRCHNKAKHRHETTEQRRLNIFQQHHMEGGEIETHQKLITVKKMSRFVLLEWKIWQKGKTQNLISAFSFTLRGKEVMMRAMRAMRAPLNKTANRFQTAAEEENPSSIAEYREAARKPSPTLRKSTATFLLYCSSQCGSCVFNVISYKTAKNSPSCSSKSFHGVSKGSVGVSKVFSFSMEHQVIKQSPPSPICCCALLVSWLKEGCCTSPLIHCEIGRCMTNQMATQCKTYFYSEHQN